MTSTSSSSGSFRRWKKILLFALYATSAVVIWLNIQPYISIVEFWLSGADKSPFWQWFSQLWLISWIVQYIANPIGFTVMGFCLWLVFQLFELAPFILRRNAAAMRLLIRGVESFQQLDIKDKDDEFLRGLKEHHNAIPRRLLNIATLMAVLFYVADGILCFLAYPPIRGGIDGLGLFFIAPALEDINLQNLMSAITTLFGVEAIVRGIYWVRNVGEVFGSETIPRADKWWKRKKGKKSDRQI